MPLTPCYSSRQHQPCPHPGFPRTLSLLLLVRLLALRVRLLAPLLAKLLLGLLALLLKLLSLLLV